MSITSVRTKGVLKLGALVALSVCLLMVFATSAFAADFSVGSAAELDSAFADADSTINITLTGDITSTGALVAQDGKLITLNLNGKTLTMSGSLSVRGASLNIVGPGKVQRLTDDALTISTRAVSGQSTQLNIGAGVEVSNPNGYGVGIYPATGTNTANDTQVTIAGTVNAKWFAVTTNGLINDMTNAPVIDVAAGATLTSSDDSAIYAAGYATWNLGAASVTGATGIFAKAGIINIDGATISANGAKADPLFETNGATPTGSAIVLQSLNPPYAGGIELNVVSGTITSANNAAIEEVTSETAGTSETELAISGGEFHGAEGVGALVVSTAGIAANPDALTGGTFSSQPAEELLADGFTYETLSSGMVRVIPVVEETPGSSEETSTSTETPGASTETTSTSTDTTTTAGDDTTNLSDTTDDTETIEAVETGDDANLALYVSMFLGALGATAGVLKKTGVIG